MKDKKINNNIVEDYVSFEVAKLLKEKGFDVSSVGIVNEKYDRDSFKEFQYFLVSQLDKPNYFRLPTYGLAIKWIRENFDINIDVASYYNYNKIDKKFYEIGISHKENSYEGLLENASNRILENWIENPKKYWLFDTPEEGVEAGLLHILQNLI